MGGCDKCLAGGVRVCGRKLGVGSCEDDVADL